MKPPSQSLSFTELWIWCAVGALLLAWKLAPTFEPVLTNDSFQYLSVARNFKAGLPGQTSIIHFDEERARATIPAALTTFPSGYPLAIAALSHLGMSLEQASLLISVLATLGCAALMLLIARRIGLTRVATRVAVAIYLLNESTLLYAGSSLTEPLFALIVLAGIALIMESLGDSQGANERAIIAAIAAGVLFGLSYWVRYAGLFVLVGLIALAMSHALLRNTRQLRQLAVTVAVAGTIVAIGLWRNTVLSGSWRGGNTKGVDHTVRQTLSSLLVSIDDMMFGSQSVDETLIWRGVMTVVLLIGASAFAVIAVKRYTVNLSTLRQQSRAPELALAMLVLVYGAGVTYAGWKTVISFDSRMLYPLLPEAALLIGAGVALIERLTARPVAWLAMVGVFVVSYVGLHAQSLLRQPFSSAQDAVARNLRESLPAGTNAHAFIKDRLDADDVIMSNLGQATGYVLQQPTISFVSSEYSNTPWDESSIRSVAAQFGAKLLILHHAPDQSLESQVPSDFLRGLAGGATSPLLTRLAHTPSVSVYRLNLLPDREARIPNNNSSNPTVQ